MKKLLRIRTPIATALFTVMTFAVGHAQTCYVNWTTVYQKIDGFGASSAFTSAFWTWDTNLANTFFSTNDVGTNICIGLSLLRNQIQPATTTNGIAFPTANETNLMRWAQDRGAQVWSTPWSPPAFFKTPHTNNGGSYNPSFYTNQLYAEQVAGYVASMKSRGINIYAVSVQNEPDAVVTTYPACTWNSTQIRDYVTNLYSALVASNVASTKILLPESQNWNDPSGLATLSLNNSGVRADVGIVANHNYVSDNLDGDQTTPVTVTTFGKALWETEVAQLGGTFDTSIDNALYWANRIYLFMTAPQANAWHYWWMIAFNGDNAGLMTTSRQPAKRMYAIGQFSRFVRPGYYRMAAGLGAGAVLSTAYQETNSGMYAIVFINTGSTDATQLVEMVNFPAVSTVTPWITSSSLSLARQPACAITNTSPFPSGTTNYPSFTYVLPAMSVVTFVGQATNVAPTPLPVADQTINAQQTLLVTNVAPDPNAPPLNLSFTLLSSPPGATLTPLNATNAVFSWTPSVNQANTTNLVTVVVADNAIPSLMATNGFNVIVNPLPPPVLIPVPDQVVNAGVTLLVTNTAIDSYVPPLNLTFSLLNGPAGAALVTPDATNGVFAWRPLVSQANTTTPVSIVVADGGSPSLSATNNFMVTVNPLTNPVFGAVTVLGGQVNLTVSGPEGPDYTLLTATNLTGVWQALYTTNSPIVPLTLVDTNAADPARFYRIQIGP